MKVDSVSSDEFAAGLRTGGRTAPGPGAAMRSTAIRFVLGGILGLGLALTPAGAPPRASSRPYTPLTVSIAKADVIAAIRVLSEPTVPVSSEGLVRVQAALLRTFKGSPAGTGLTLVLAPFERDLGYRLAPGREYVAFLGRTGKTGEYRLADETLLPHDDLVSTRLGATVPLVPRWSDAPGGLASIVVPDHEPSIADGRDPFRYRLGEPVLVWAGYRNVSARDIVLRYRDWPLASHTRWDLRVERAGAGVVEPLRHPHVDVTQIREFFSRNPHRFEYRLRAGETFFLYLDRINLAEPGWGYRERLDFRHFPMTSPGEYTISAVGRFFHSGPPVPTRPFRVWVAEDSGR